MMNAMKSLYNSSSGAVMESERPGEKLLDICCLLSEFQEKVVVIYFIGQAADEFFKSGCNRRTFTLPSGNVVLRYHSCNRSYSFGKSFFNLGQIFLDIFPWSCCLFNLGLFFWFAFPGWGRGAVSCCSSEERSVASMPAVLAVSEQLAFVSQMVTSTAPWSRGVTREEQLSKR